MSLISIHAVSEALKRTITRHCWYVNAVLFCNSWPDDVGQLNTDSQHPETLTPAAFERSSKDKARVWQFNRIECSSGPWEGFRSLEVLEYVDSVLSGHRIAPDDARIMPILLAHLCASYSHVFEIDTLW